MRLHGARDDVALDEGELLLVTQGHDYQLRVRIREEGGPVLCFAFPRLPVAISARVLGASPAPFRPPVLWNPDGLSPGGAVELSA